VDFNKDERLKELSNLADKNDSAVFYQSMEKIFQELLVDHAQDPTIKLNIENFNSHFSNHQNIAETDLAKFASLYKQIELARYGGSSQSNLSELYQVAEDIFLKLS